MNNPNYLLWRVVLIGEDGRYTLKDGYTTMSKAEYVAYRLSSNYGEGQRVAIESYSPFCD